MYDMIVLGATFAAAGIAQVLKEKCLILDSKPYAGHEFISALHYGSGYDKPLKTPEGQKLLETFVQRQALTEDRVCLFNCASPFYQLLEELPILLNMQILSVEKEEDGFVCTAHGISGYRTFRAKQVIDTRSRQDFCLSKTYNLLMDGEGSLSLPAEVTQEKWGLSRNYVLRCQVSPDAGYSDARLQAIALLKNLPEGHKLVLCADEFDVTIRKDHPKAENGITYLPSKAYENPVLAFDAGVSFASGGEW